MKNYRIIILGFFALLALVFEVYFGIRSLVYFFIQVILIANLASIVYFFMRSRRDKSYIQILQDNILTIMAVVGIFLSIIFSFLTYHTYVPAKLADITITNGSGSVVFLQMSHIASEDFFIAKREKLQALAADGYTILAEGVKPGTPESTAKFDAHMGLEFTETLYDTIARMAGLQAQDNTMLYSGISTGSLVSVDLSLDDVVGLIQDEPTIVSGEVVDIEAEITRAIDTMNDKDKRFLSFVLKALLNWSLKNSGSMEQSLMQGERAPLFRTIIEKRNDPIVEYIRTHPGEKIVVVYGALHFNGVYTGLQKLDKNWHIESIIETYPYID